MSNGKTIHEQARETPVYGECDVLVVGAGPAGCAAAASAAQIGADTVLVERYGCLGGMSTAGLVAWIDRMTDWDGTQLIAGFANDVLGSLPKDAILGPPREIWGSKDEQLVGYWRDRANAYHGTVTWSPTVDPELFKIAYLDTLQKTGARLLLHSWAVAVVQEDDELHGVVFESKSGRFAVIAKQIIDTTGDGDIFAFTGTDYDTDTVKADPDDEVNRDFVVSSNIHDNMNVSFMLGGVDMDGYLAFRNDKPGEFSVLMKAASEQGFTYRGHVMPRNDLCLFMGPKFSGHSCLNVEDLTTVEIESRRRMMDCLAFFRTNMPGFQNAWVMETASQIGTRHSRRLRGAKSMTQEEWRGGISHGDEVGQVPSPNPRYPKVSVPLGCLVPARLENLLVAGRNLSCDAVTHGFMREIPVCWVTGQAAGAAAATAVAAGTRVRDVEVSEVQKQLISQGAVLQRKDI